MPVRSIGFSRKLNTVVCLILSDLRIDNTILFIIAKSL